VRRAGFFEEMGMATEHEARLHGIENLPDGRDTVIRFTAVPQPGWTPMHEENIDMTESQTFFYIAAQEVGTAF
jgi:hypothetical protein